MLGAGQAVLSYLIVESVGADAQHLCAFTVLACHILGLLLPRTVSTLSRYVIIAVVVPYALRHVSSS